MRPMNEQICVTKNMVKSFGTFFKNVPEYVEEFHEARLVIGEYEIWWDKKNPTEFSVVVGVYSPGSYWEPPEFDIKELATLPSLYAAVLFVAQRSLDAVFGDYMGGEGEYEMDQAFEAAA